MAAFGSDIFDPKMRKSPIFTSWDFEAPHNMCFQYPSPYLVRRFHPEKTLSSTMREEAPNHNSPKTPIPSSCVAFSAHKTRNRPQNATCDQRITRRGVHSGIYPRRPAPRHPARRHPSPLQHHNVSSTQHAHQEPASAFPRFINAPAQSGTPGTATGPQTQTMAPGTHQATGWHRV